MKSRLKHFLAGILIFGFSLCSYSQVSTDSIQKLIRESLQEQIDNGELSKSDLENLKMLSGKFGVNLDNLFKEVNKDIERAKSSGDIGQLKGGYYKLSSLDSVRGNYKSAYENYKLYSLYRDSLQKKENEKKELQYEFDKKQAIAKVEQEKKDAEARRVKNLQYFTIAGLSVLVLVIFLVAMIQWRNNRQRKKTNELLQLQNEKVESALSDLKSTQSQLIQSEKMASLGELTAGIAHEIQNPLNFVNNFSEVNRELVDELKTELVTGNTQMAITIAGDIKDNSDKITYHGKRADAIVKGMLQHSRSGNGQKEPTDINDLCDEYLRIAYHGLQAKDTSFEAKLETIFDNSIGEINIVPQDIGRVMLNLINNAFYAADEKKKKAAHSFEPTVTVGTKRNNGKIEIKVSDNGNGIPQTITDKIFQPFFTTKPTGKGTGLGLSLAYDIVKAHGGEIKVVTAEGEGTTFSITLPVKQHT